MTQDKQIVNGTSYHPETPQGVIDMLERARQYNLRVRLFYGDPQTGRDWLEEHDTQGTIGRSMGPVKIPILIHNARSLGGGAILDHCIVRITIDKLNVYRHPDYHLPDFKLKYNSDPGNEYTVSVMDGNEVIARFPDEGKARKWLDFIRGNRNLR